MSKIVLALLLASTIVLHGGNTDIFGGHIDHENGGYHYHHGYPAHNHYDMDNDGDVDCPYKIRNDEPDVDENKTTTEAEAEDEKQTEDEKEVNSLKEWLQKYGFITLCGAVILVNWLYNKRKQPK